MPELRRQIQILSDRQNAVVAAIHKRLDGLTDAQMRWKPDPKRWSIADIVDHLIRIHASTSTQFMRVLQAAPPAGDEGKEEIPYGWSDRTLIGMHSPGSKLAGSVPKLYQPVEHNGSLGRVVQHLYEEFEALRVIIEYADQKRLKGLKMRPPTGGILHPTVLGFLDAMIQHDRMYLLQIEEIQRNPAFPKA